MDETRKTGKFKRICKGVLGFFFEVFGELIIFVIAFAIGLGLVLLFGIDFKDLDSDSIVICITLMGFLVISAILILRFWIKKLRSKNKANKDIKSNTSLSVNDETN